MTARTRASLDSGRQRVSGLASKLTWTSPCSIASRVAILVSSPRSRSTAGLSTATGCGDGWFASSSASSSRTTTALRSRSYRSRAASRSEVRRSAWRALSSSARRSSSAFSVSVRRSRASDRVSRSRSSLARPSSPSRRCAVASPKASSATLSRPGFLAPLARSPPSARSSCFFARLVPRSAPLIDAWRRSRSADSSRWSPASSWWRTDAVDRKKPSVGTPESSASSSSARTGSVTTSSPTSSRTVPLAPRKCFSRRPSWTTPSSSSQVNESATQGRASGPEPHGASPSISAAVVVGLRVRASSIARWRVDLPASLGPRTTVRPGASSIVVSR